MVVRFPPCVEQHWSGPPVPSTGPGRTGQQAVRGGMMTTDLPWTPAFLHLNSLSLSLALTLPVYVQYVSVSLD